MNVTVLGAGAWGTALAVHASATHPTRLWARDAAQAAQMRSLRRNRRYLGDVVLPPALQVTAGFDAALAHAAGGLVVIATPMAALDEMLCRLDDAPAGVLWLCKGFQQGTGWLGHEVARAACPARPVGVLSGPSFAAEVARGLPAAVTLATSGEALGRELSYTLSHQPFRCYWTDDVVGAEIGGAVKNVYAIAAGIVTGKNFGASAHAALVTRSFAEMMRFGAALGARRETMTGLSGLGDLVLTCGSPQSRNMSLGIALGQGKSLDEALDKRLTVTEGVYTASALAGVAAARNIDMPIAQAVHAVISGRASVDEAIGALLARPLRAEVS
jgi:glycerol-3-phosphate dehydrogenase (NAD(P)+)